MNLLEIAEKVPEHRSELLSLQERLTYLEVDKRVLEGLLERVRVLVGAQAGVSIFDAIEGFLSKYEPGERDSYSITVRGEIIQQLKKLGIGFNAKSSTKKLAVRLRSEVDKRSPKCDVCGKPVRICGKLHPADKDRNGKTMFVCAKCTNVV